MQSREIRLKSYPQGMPTAADFELVTTEVSDHAGNGEVLIRNLFMSVDPYMRGRMSGQKTYIDPFPLGEALSGGAVGRVIASGHKDFPVGALVLNFQGWREVFKTNDHRPLRRLPELPGIAPSLWLGALGMPGLTAYGGLLDIAAMKDGETVFVSGAAGAVGSLVGQIAKIKGGTVIGSCGSADKARYLKEELGFDTVLNYKDAPVAAQLAKAAPKGIDVYFDNVGGDHLEAAISCMRERGRIALCGAIAQYNDTGSAPGPRNLMIAIGRRLTLKGFISSDFQPLQDTFVKEMSAWLASGRIKSKETVVNGIDQAVGAFLGLFQGDNTGKMIVKI